jgi:membrane protein implicated in regulation of membrane protease activity
MLDVRWPIGTLFATLGLLLAGYGLATAGNTEQYARSLSINVNLWWGVVMLVFGVVLLLAAWVGRNTLSRTGTRSPEAEAIEARERRLGLERDAR